jgi:hypothetical protein
MTGQVVWTVDRIWQVVVRSPGNADTIHAKRSRQEYFLWRVQERRAAEPLEREEQESSILGLMSKFRDLIKGRKVREGGGNCRVLAVYIGIPLLLSWALFMCVANVLAASWPAHYSLSVWQMCGIY